MTETVWKVDYDSVKIITYFYFFITVLFSTVKSTWKISDSFGAIQFLHKFFNEVIVSIRHYFLALTLELIVTYM